MKAWTKHTYGGPEILQLQEVPKPSVKEGHILVKVRANSANPADWHILRGAPFFARFSLGIFKPKEKILGADFAGEVEAVGKGVTHIEVSSRVYGEAEQGGAFAEYVRVPVEACGRMPKEATFTEMAAVPVAGLTALQALIRHGKLRSKETVLINGASGGVGHIAVQIAKAYGANVTGVCSARNREFVKSLGADEVIAYDEENIHQHEGMYDLVLDVHGNLHGADFRRMGSRGVLVGFTTMRNMVSVLLGNVFHKFSLSVFTAEAHPDDLERLTRLYEEGSLKTHIEKRYSYEEIPEAITYIEKMRTRGKVVMEWE